MGVYINIIFLGGIKMFKKMIALMLMLTVLFSTFSINASALTAGSSYSFSEASTGVSYNWPQKIGADGYTVDAASAADLAVSFVNG